MKISVHSLILDYVELLSLICSGFRWDLSDFALIDLTKQWQMGKLLKMHLLPKLIRLGYSTRSTIEEHTEMFN